MQKLCRVCRDDDVYEHECGPGAGSREGRAPLKVQFSLRISNQRLVVVVIVVSVVIARSVDSFCKATLFPDADV